MPKRKKALPARSSASVPEPQVQPALVRAVQAVRAAVGAVLDLADAAADALTKRLDA
jgi:hypothetical protein